MLQQLSAAILKQALTVSNTFGHDKTA